MESVKTRPSKEATGAMQDSSPAECPVLENNLMGKEAMQLEAKEEMKLENLDGNSNSACTHMLLFSS